MSKEFVDLIKQEVKDRLPNWKGQMKYPCDLGYELTEYENANGSWHCSAYSAKEDIKKYFDDMEEYQSWYRLNFGEADWFESDPDDYHNSLECFHCRMMINAVDVCFNRAFDIAFENTDIWNEKTEIDQDFIDKINTALEEVDEIW